MPVPLIVYENLCRIYGEKWVTKFYTPISAVRKYHR